MHRFAIAFVIVAFSGEGYFHSLASMSVTLVMLCLHLTLAPSRSAAVNRQQMILLLSQALMLTVGSHFHDRSYSLTSLASNSVDQAALVPVRNGISEVDDNLGLDVIVLLSVIFAIVFSGMTLINEVMNVRRRELEGETKIAQGEAPVTDEEEDLIQYLEGVMERAVQLDGQVRRRWWVKASDWDRSQLYGAADALACDVWGDVPRGRLRLIPTSCLFDARRNAGGLGVTVEGGGGNGMGGQPPVVAQFSINDMSDGEDEDEDQEYYGSSSSSAAAALQPAASVFTVEGLGSTSSTSPVPVPPAAPLSSSTSPVYPISSGEDYPMSTIPLSPAEVPPAGSNATGVFALDDGDEI
eukprot:GILI01021204.1.p1 GENE.GILI01021204.1~~GILI01021204.1.p1  ORF type:complete len:411 (+),score=111.79 GILI01021204.1:172-1233(+)